MLKMTEEDKEDLAEKIAQKVFEKNQEKDDREKERLLRSEVWEEGTDFLFCKVCTRHVDSVSLPPELRKFTRNRETIG